MDVLCVLTDSHRQPQTSCVCWRTPTDVLCVLNRQPTWAKITRTVHGKGQRAESKDKRADMCTDAQPQTSSTDVLCVLADTHGRLVCTEQTAHRADMCTDGQPRTSSTDVLCVLADTHGHPVQPTWAKITRTVHGKGQGAESKDQRADIQPTWAKTTRTVHGKGQHAESKDQRADMCTDGQPRMSSTDVLCVLADTHGRRVCIEQTAHVGQNHPNSPREGPACSVQGPAHGRPMCADGQPQTSCVFWRTPTDVLYSPRGPKSPKQSTGRASVLSPRTGVLSPRTSVLICVQMDSHGRPVCADGHTRTHMEVICVLTDTHGRPVQPTWAKITRTVHGKGQRAESKEQRADMCTDGQPQTSCVASVLSPRTNVLICVLMDSHGRPVCADGHTQTHTDSHGRPVQPTWAKITRTVHGKGQRAESKEQRADMCTDGQPQTSRVC
ncbi:unnamed protein product [Brassica rapa]|uniref:Uncharacterized protein n=1 Tax=Brassica campestris TaxID=3711 RepID=A0A8D9DF33_BRACM|nr:unnamed protein product [Brassica rapa]